ncbi:hypothetical protein N9219_03120 [bacterium]|nr:hypothetical protein [bacterium]
MGTDIIIGIEDSAFISPFASPDSPKFYHAKILWQKNIISGFFEYSYGTKFVYFKNRQTVPDTNSVTIP